MVKLLGLDASERAPFFTMALLFFADAIVEASNEVIGTSGFISHLGAPQILWVWAADALVILFTASAYALIVDRANRRRLAIALHLAFGTAYALIYLLFAAGGSDKVAYTALMLINSQQNNILVILTGALASDLFSVSAAKRVFGLLGCAAILGELSGNALAVLLARWLGGQSAGLLLSNAIWLWASAAVLAVAVRRLPDTTRQARASASLLALLREGAVFMRKVTLFRYLSWSVLLLGVGWVALQYQFLVDLARAYPETGELQFSYGIYKLAVPLLLLLVQTVGLRWLMKHWGFKSIFTLMPGVLFGGLLAMLLWPQLLSVVLACYLAQVVSQGIHTPSESAFLGLVPDELRGRIGAFLHGFLYQVGYLLGYGLVALIWWATYRHWLTVESGRWLYLTVACAGCGLALALALRFRVEYDKSMLDWRWQRRRRQSAFEGI
ncbi:MAG: hypothetical protein U0Y68_09265 [Blastocatellia bacterium]